MNLLQQLRTRLQRRPHTTTSLPDRVDGSSEDPVQSRDQYLTSEHFHDLSEKNNDAG